MSTPSGADREGQVCDLIRRAQAGDRPARDVLVALLYEEFRALARRRMSRERPDHTLQATALVNEALRKLLCDTTIARATDRNFLLRAASRAMDQVLTDHARHRNRAGGPGGKHRVPLGAIAEPADLHQVSALDGVIERLEGFERISVSQLIGALEALDDLDPRSALVARYRYLLQWPISRVASELSTSGRTSTALAGCSITC
ncbi:ECF sigma factor [Aquisphaera giovannonii]|uniref:ECF sigma factor n=1 Tax=Aquisphaera giovannonii TaxID=406548 RepID=A0A5B9VVQ1_9BACT|nr:ECF-type sigma factor [Aquisphaera giovannonii]QEH32526.1 ECF sigma factor [Aquisphaera giovannonii]